MNRRRLVGVLVLVSSVLAACGVGIPGGSNTSTSSSVLTIAIGIDPDTLDPMKQTTTTVQNIVQMIVESLATLDQQGKIQPGLATAWHEASDSMSWTFDLRTGVKFSDGVPFDATAAKANFDRLFDPSNICSGCGALPKAVKSVDVVDPDHIKFTMNVPLASDVFLGLLSTAQYGIMSPRATAKGTKTYAKQEQPVGTGPYVLKERVLGDHVTLARNDGYWGKRPAYAQQVFKVVPDDATREALVRSGQAQVVLLPPITDVPSLQRDTTVHVLLAPGDRTVFIALDTQDKQQPLLQNPQVRVALNLAINRDAIVKSTLYGAADPATSAMAPSIFGYCAQTPYKYDPETARTMLQRANASGLQLSLISPSGRYIQDYQAAQNVANDLRAVGVNVTGPRSYDWPSYVATINVPPARASVDAHLLGWAPSFLDASQAMTQFDPNMIPPHGLETSYYDNSSVSALLNKAQSETNRDARAQEYCDAQKQVWNDAPWIFLWTEKFPIVYSAQVTGIGSIPTDSFYTVYARPASKSSQG